MAQFCSTSLKTSVAFHAWTIREFSSVANYMKIRSKVFTVRSCYSDQTVALYYQLQCSPNNPGYSSSASVLIEAYGDSTIITRGRIYADIVLDGSSYSCMGIIEPNVQIGKGMTVPRSTLTSDWIKDDDLKLRFTCTLHEEFIDNELNQKEIFKQMPDALLVDHFGGLLTSNKFSDVTLIIEKKQFPAHKNILAARSPVFEAMFNHEMQESKENTVNIIDIKPDVFQEVLRFIYTGTVQNIDKHASELLIAAEKYALDNLKTKCGEYLGSKLSVETATATLALADKYNARELKQQAIQFISQHVKQLNPADWKEVLTNNFDVAAEIIAQMVKEK